MTHGLETDHELMVLRVPGELQFIPMNPLFHVLMPSIINESPCSL